MGSHQSKCTTLSLSMTKTLARDAAGIGDGTAMSGSLAGESLWFARRKFTQTQTRAEISNQQDQIGISNRIQAWLTRGEA
jgi:hypothetical protein